MKLDVEMVKLEIYVPEEYIASISEGLNQLGILNVGLYDYVSAWQKSCGTWRPLPGSHPFDGTENQLCTGQEVKLEVHCPIERVHDAIKVIRSIHPYEEPVINIIPLLNESQI